MLINADEGSVEIQHVGPSPFDGSSSPEGTTAAILDTRGGVWVLEGRTWRRVREVPDAVAVDVGDGGAPLVIAERQRLCIDERCVQVGDDIVDVALSENHVAVATLTGGMWLLDVHTGATLAVFRGHAARIASVEFGPAGAWLVTGSWDGTARLWDLDALDTPPETLLARSDRIWGLGLEEALRAR